MPGENISLLISDTESSSILENVILLPAGYLITQFYNVRSAVESFQAKLPDLLIVGDDLGEIKGHEFINGIGIKYPELPIIFFNQKQSEALELQAYRSGAMACISAPLASNTILQTVGTCLLHNKRMEERITHRARRNTKSLEMRLAGLEALTRVGRSVTSVLDLDGVLKAVVDAAVELTGAEEGSLLLLDETTGDLYMRAARNFQDEFVRTFRLPIRDSLPGQVLRSGKPLLFNDKIPQKIKTSYLVHTVVFVPLQVQGRGIGVLGVDNRHSGHPFTEHHIQMVTALADYAAIAIENANLFSRTEVERKKLEAILTHVEDGVIVVDNDFRILLINQAVCSTFNITESNIVGQRIQDIIHHSEVLEILENGKTKKTNHSEITLEDGRVFNAQLTPIPSVGLVVTMQDITHLKELDRIKTEFVSTVSHDLRSPLTAILGYVDLIERIGPVNDQQREFIHRVQTSVSNITSLINDLLDLGRIEAGFDAQKEIVPLSAVIHYGIDRLRPRLEAKQQELQMDFSDDLPAVLGNPVRLRQMVGNLLVNAIQYTQSKGRICVSARAEGDQVIVSISDNGPGIPPADQPYIFDKFYRASNVSPDVQGTGLGLAIVKSIVEDHLGRIWVNSVLWQGSTFTVVLPVVQEGIYGV